MKARDLVIYIFTICLVCGLIFYTLKTPGWGIQTLSAGVFDIIYAQPADLPAQQSCGSPHSSADSCSGEPIPGCSVFTISKGDQVFFGGNDDYITLDSNFWVDPGGEDSYGAVWIGAPDDVQQGVNQMGLAYDANGLPEVTLNPHPERIPYTGGNTGAQIQILRECATIECAIEWATTHAWHPLMNDQKHFADASGDAVIISPGPDGELAFTRKPPGDGFIASTNFNVANPNHGDYPSWRYDTMQEKLAELVEQEGELSIRDAAGVLDAVHVEEAGGWTRNSLVADLPNKIIYLYYFHQFDNPIVINVLEELENPHEPGPLSQLFPADVQGEAARRYRQIQAKSNTCKLVGMAWIGSVLASLAILLVFSIRKRQGLVFWLPVVAILGPLGLLVWLVSGRKRITSTWQTAAVEAAGDVMPSVVVFAIIVGLDIFTPSAQSQGAQLFLFFGLPLLVGLLLFHGPLLAMITKKGYLSTILQRLPQAWVAANLGFAGINTIASPLLNITMPKCITGPTISVWAIGTLWAIIALGAVLGWLLLLVYEAWAVRRGFKAWSVLGTGNGEVNTPGWRSIWWWIILSYAILIAGFIASAIIQQQIAQ